MKERMTIRQNGQVTLPKNFLKYFDLKEGDTLDIEETENGDILLIPMVYIPAKMLKDREK